MNNKAKVASMVLLAATTAALTYVAYNDVGGIRSAPTTAARNGFTATKDFLGSLPATARAAYEKKFKSVVASGPVVASKTLKKQSEATASKTSPAVVANIVTRVTNATLAGATGAAALGALYVGNNRNDIESDLAGATGAAALGALYVGNNRNDIESENGERLAIEPDYKQLHKAAVRQELAETRAAYAHARGRKIAAKL